MWSAGAIAHRASTALAALGCAVTLAACDAVSAPPAEDDTPSTQGGSMDVAGAAAAGMGAAASAGSGAAPSPSGSFTPPAPVVVADAGTPAPTAPDAGPMDAGPSAQPAAGCMLGTTRVVTCPLPASRCMSESTLIFFENPRCVDGRCTADAKLMRCTSGFCSTGTCGSNLTLL